jgi:hypothetical protein
MERLAGLKPAAIWAELPPENRRWIWLNALIITAVINVIINGAIDLVSIAGKGPIPFIAAPLVEPSTFWTIIGTLFLLPLLTCLLATTAVWRDIREGRLSRLTTIETSDALPDTRLRRGLVFGLVATIVAAPPILIVLALAGLGDLSHAAYTFWHILFAVLLGALVTPVIALCAMTDRPPPAE